MTFCLGCPLIHHVNVVGGMEVNIGTEAEKRPQFMFFQVFKLFDILSPVQLPLLHTGN